MDLADLSIGDRPLLRVEEHDLEVGQRAPERALGMLRPGMKVALRASAWPQETFTAQIGDIEDALDPASRETRYTQARVMRNLSSDSATLAEAEKILRPMLTEAPALEKLNFGWF